MDQIEVKQVSAPQASKCIFVITDAEGHMTARLTSRSAVNDTCELIEQWAGHRKLQRYLYSNILGYTYSEPAQLRRLHLIKLLDLAPATAHITIFVCNSDEESLELTITKTSTERTGKDRKCLQ